MRDWRCRITGYCYLLIQNIFTTFVLIFPHSSWTKRIASGRQVSLRELLEQLPPRATRAVCVWDQQGPAASSLPPTISDGAVPGGKRCPRQLHALCVVFCNAEGKGSGWLFPGLGSGVRRCTSRFSTSSLLWLKLWKIWIWIWFSPS